MDPRHLWWVALRRAGWMASALVCVLVLADGLLGPSAAPAQQGSGARDAGPWVSQSVSPSLFAGDVRTLPRTQPASGPGRVVPEGLREPQGSLAPAPALRMDPVRQASARGGAAGPQTQAALAASAVIGPITSFDGIS